MLQDTIHVTCPYCGEGMNLVVDIPAGSQVYVEDCAVCCRPLEVSVEIDGQGACCVSVAREDS